jgi:thioredoxin 1
MIQKTQSETLRPQRGVAFPGSKEEPRVMPALEITSTNFQGEVVESDVPVLVDFWAEWCGPCRMVGPVVDEISEDYAGRIKVAKLDVDAEPGLAGRFGVLSIPTIVLFKDGEVIEQSVGAKPKDRLVRELNLEGHAA